MTQSSPFASCIAKQDLIKESFKHCITPQLKYEKIIELGRKLPPFPKQLMLESHLVSGCQSQMYLHTTYSNGKVHFQAYSEALISAGLAALLLAVYNEESPETILACPPAFLEGLGIQNVLSPHRANGLHSLFLKMKSESVKLLI